MDGNGLVPLIKDLSDNEKGKQKGYVVVDLSPEFVPDRNRNERKS